MPTCVDSLYISVIHDRFLDMTHIHNHNKQCLEVAVLGNIVPIRVCKTTLIYSAVTSYPLSPPKCKYADHDLGIRKQPM